MAILVAVMLPRKLKGIELWVLLQARDALGLRDRHLFRGLSIATWACDLCFVQIDTLSEYHHHVLVQRSLERQQFI